MNPGSTCRRQRADWCRLVGPSAIASRCPQLQPLAGAPHAHVSAQQPSPKEQNDSPPPPRPRGAPQAAEAPTPLCKIRHIFVHAVYPCILHGSINHGTRLLTVSRLASASAECSAVSTAAKPSSCCGGRSSFSKRSTISIAWGPGLRVGCPVRTPYTIGAA